MSMGNTINKQTGTHRKRISAHKKSDKLNRDILSDQNKGHQYMAITYQHNQLLIKNKIVLYPTYIIYESSTDHESNDKKHKS